MIYYDNAATTYPKPEFVYSFMDKFYRTNGVNVDRGKSQVVNSAEALVRDTKELLLQLFHCNTDKEVVLTPSATEALNVILQGLNLEKGQMIYITPFEHNAVLRPLHYLKKRYGFNIRQLDVDKKNLTYNLDKIKYMFQDQRPDYMIITHASNVFGNIAPIKELCQLAKHYGATTVVDMSQTAGLIDTNLTEVLADYTVFAGHKTIYGPFGIAGFVQFKSSTLKPLIYGGTGIDSANPEMPVCSKRFEAGSQNILSIAGLNAALRWNFEIGIKSIRDRELETTEKLLQLIQKYYNITILRAGEEDSNIGVISCLFDGYGSDSIGQILSEHDISVRTGLHCAPLAHKFMRTAPDGTVRFSISYFTRDEDLLALKSVLDYIQING